MSTTTAVTDMLNGMIQSLKSVIPVTVTVKKPTVIDKSYDQQKMGVLIGMTGEVRGTILIDSDEDNFQSLGAVMFGMQIEGEMLLSFVGEFGNMLAGTLATHIASNGFELDITPPTVMSGNTKLYGFKQAIILPFDIKDIGEFTVLVAIK